MPALTFLVSASFCFANSFAFSSLRNVSVAREKARFAGDILFCSNETYQVSWGLTAMGVLAGNETASSFRSPAATLIVSHGRGARRPGRPRANWPLAMQSLHRARPPGLILGQNVKLAKLALNLLDTFDAARVGHAVPPACYGRPTIFIWHDGNGNWRCAFIKRSQLFRKNPNQISARNLGFSHTAPPGGPR